MVTLVTNKIPTGVLQSIRGQARKAASAGLPIDFIIANPDKSEAIEGNLRLERYRPARVGRRFDKWLKLRRLRSIAALDRYDTLLLRYPQGLDLDPLALFRRKGQRVVTIHHTKDLEEFLSTGWSARSLGRWALERVNGGRILKRVDGIVGLTDEIRDYELARISGRRPPAITVANGIDVSLVPMTGFVPYDGNTLRMFFVGSDPSPWHGVDRLIASARAFRRSLAVTVDVVGEQGHVPGTEVRQDHLVIRYHGTLRGDDLDRLAGHANLAVGSLGAFRKQMKQGCALKLREYVARGLPFIYGYDDVDIPTNAPFALRVPNDESLLDVETIEEFARRTSQEPGMSRSMRDFAEEKLDWAVKLRQLVSFAETLEERN
jgi:glycosyltransferase involved in cell wall biosynthesis